MADFKSNSHLNNMVELWRGFSQEAVLEKPNIELEVYKKLLRFFQAGDYYYVIFNLSTIQIEAVSPSIKDVLGYDASEMNLEIFLNLMHPDDQIMYVNAEKEVGRFLFSLPKEKIPNYKIQHDYRFRRKDGVYRRILMQIVTIEQHEDGGIHKTLGIHTDITHLKPSGNTVLSFIGLNGDPSYYDVKPGNALLADRQLLTKREREILSFIMNGKLNKEIAEQLHISKQTVDKHRKNMLAKTNCKNSNELITKAIQNGWV